MKFDRLDLSNYIGSGGRAKTTPDAPEAWTAEGLGKAKLNVSSRPRE